MASEVDPRLSIKPKSKKGHVKKFSTRAHWLRTEQPVSGKKEFDQSLTAIGKEDADGPVKLVIFMRVIGPRMNDVVDGIVFWMVRTKQILVWL